MADQEFALPNDLRGRKDMEYWAGRYPPFERDKDEQLKKILTHARRNERGLTYDELRFLFVWKSGPRNLRYLEDTPKVESLSRKALKNRCVRPLCGLLGIQIPTASVALHFAYPTEFPVIDRRVLVTTGYFTEEESQKKTIGPRLWDKYVKWCVPMAEYCEVSLRDFDRGLWQYDVEKAFRKNYWPKQSPTTRK